MDILDIVKNLFFSAFTVDFTVYIISSWIVLSLFCLVINSLLGKKAVKR